MEKVIANQVEFVRTLCLKRNKRSAKQWADLSVLERTEVVEAVKCECKDDVDRLTKDASPWCARFLDYLDSLLNAEETTTTTPKKLVVLKVPVKKAEKKAFKRRKRFFFKSCFDDDALNSTITAKTTSLAKLLFFKAVQRFGHLNVEYAREFFERASRRSNDVYGNPRTTRAKVRVVDAIGDESLSRKFYAAGPAILNEADLTVVFARNLPSVVADDDDDVELFRIITFSNGAYRIGMQLSILIPNNGGNPKDGNALSVSRR